MVQRRLPGELPARAAERARSGRDRRCRRLLVRPAGAGGIREAAAGGRETIPLPLESVARERALERKGIADFR